MRRQIITRDKRKVQVLRVPYYYQSNKDALCFVFSLKMCIEYFKNIFDDDFIKNHTPHLSIDDLKKLTHTDDFIGTRIDRSLLNELSREIPSLKFSLNENCSIDMLKNNFNKNLPTIVLYDCSYMLYDERGPGHAGTVIGIIGDDDLILNNPWLGPERLVKWKDFQKGWELENNRVITIKPEMQMKMEEYYAENIG